MAVLVGREKREAGIGLTRLSFVEEDITRLCVVKDGGDLGRGRRGGQM